MDVVGIVTAAVWRELQQQVNLRHLVQIRLAPRATDGRVAVPQTKGVIVVVTVDPGALFLLPGRENGAQKRRRLGAKAHEAALVQERSGRNRLRIGKRKGRLEKPGLLRREAEGIRPPDIPRTP